VTRVFQLMVLGDEHVRKVGERASRLEYIFKGAKEGIAIGSEPFHNGLFAADLTLIVGIASVEFVDQFRTVIRMGMSRSPDDIVARGWTLISLKWSIASVREQGV